MRDKNRCINWFNEWSNLSFFPPDIFPFFVLFLDGIKVNIKVEDAHLSTKSLIIRSYSWFPEKSDSKVKLYYHLLVEKSKTQWYLIPYAYWHSLSSYNILFVMVKFYLFSNDAWQFKVFFFSRLICTSFSVKWTHMDDAIIYLNPPT